LLSLFLINGFGFLFDVFFCLLSLFLINGFGFLFYFFLVVIIFVVCLLHDLHLAEVAIPENSYLENAHVSQLHLSSQYNLILIGIVNKQVSERLHFVAEEFDRRLSVGDILVILGPSREIRAFKKDVENEFCKI